MPIPNKEKKQNAVSKKEKSTSWHELRFTTPITENADINDDFIIRGVAINETTTHNGHKYIAEELAKAAPGLMGKPLLVDHDNRVESISVELLNQGESIYFDLKDLPDYKDITETFQNILNQISNEN